MPYDFYSRFEEAKVRGDFLKIEKMNKDLYNLGHKREFTYSVIDTDKVWTEVNFNKFKISMPKNHPSIELAPRPIVFRTRYYPNFSFKNSNGKNILHVNFLDRKPLDLSLPTDKIFRTALVRKYISSLSYKKIINDVFSKDLSIPKYSILNPLKLMNSWSKTSPLMLAYNIYIYKLREIIFEENYSEFYYPKENFVIYKTEKENIFTDGEYHSYIINIFKNGYIHRIEVTVRKDLPMSNLAFTRIVKSLDFDPQLEENESLKYYTFFKSLPYTERLSNLGMVYLYSAWSLDLSNLNFIREIIQFFERNDKNQTILNPLYEFARQTSGTNFSRKDAILDEDAANRLNRGVEFEKKKEEMELGNFEMQDIENLSKEEKIKYLLKKGKRHKEIESKSVIEN